MNSARTNFLNFGPKFDRVLLDVDEIKADIATLLTGQNNAAIDRAAIRQALTQILAATNSPAWLGLGAPATPVARAADDSTTVAVSVYVDTTGQTPILLAEILAALKALPTGGGTGSATLANQETIIADEATIGTAVASVAAQLVNLEAGVKAISGLLLGPSSIRLNVAGAASTKQPVPTKPGP